VGDIGHSGYRLVAIHDSQIIQGVRLNNLGGKRLTECLIKLYDGKGYFRGLTRFYCLEQVKCNLCYLSQDYKSDMEACLKDSVSYRRTWHFLNTTNYFSSELFFVPEALFQPKMILMSIDGLPDQVIDLISHCPLDTKIKMYNNIILTGGSSQFNGLSLRLSKGIISKTKDLTIIADLLIELHQNKSSRFSILSKDTVHKIAELVGLVEVNVITPDQQPIIASSDNTVGQIMTLNGVETIVESNEIWDLQDLTPYENKYYNTNY